MDRILRFENREGRQVAAVVLSHRIPHPPAEVWQAIATAERLAQWFLPVSGELRPGGRYQFEGNAGGTITACESQRHIAATWEFGGAVSWVELDLAPEGAGTRLELRHLAAPEDGPPGFWEQYGPGATGVGWDLALIGLGQHLDGAPKLDETAFVASPEGRAMVRDSAEAWAEAAIAAGMDPEMARRQGAACFAFYTGTE